jgi:hypothetical protein
MRNDEENDGKNRGKLKSITPMELGQRHIIKFLDPKGLILEDIATILSNLDGKGLSRKSSIKYWLPELKLGRKYLTM